MGYRAYVDDTDMESLGFILMNRINPSPVRVVDAMNVQGRTPLYIDRGFYQEIKQTLKFSYIKTVDDVTEAFRTAKSVFADCTGKTLKLSYMEGWHYRIKKAVVSDSEMSGHMTSDFQVELTLEPHQYNDDGLRVIGPGVVTNQYDDCRPVYNITGEGMCTLTVNGHTFTANVGQSIVIDTERMLCFKGTERIVQSFSGDFDDITLKHGINAVTITDGFTVEIIPNWRRI